MYLFLIILIVAVVIILRWMNTVKIRSGGAEDSFSVTPLENLSTAHRAEFIDMFTEENTAGLGKRWSKEKAAQLFTYADADAKARKRTNWHYALVDAGHVVGYISITPTGLDNYPGSQLTWMVPLKQRGHGYTARGLSKLPRRGMGKIYSFVSIGNEQSNAVARKTCKLLHQANVYGSLHNVYLFKSR